MIYSLLSKIHIRRMPYFEKWKETEELAADIVGLAP